MCPPVLLLALTILLALPQAAFALGPRALVTGGPAGEVPSREATVTFEATSRAPLASGFQCRLDGGAWERCASPRRYSGLVGGTHRFEVRLVGLLVDSTPAVREWVVALGTQTLPCGLERHCPNPLPPRRPDERPRKRRDADGCAYGANRIGEVSAPTLERAVACMLSKARVRRGLPALRRDPALASAATRHGRDMVAKRYFSHVSRDGGQPSDRIRGAGYLHGARFWAVGEVMVFSQRSFTPRHAVQAWLRSPSHRRVVLNPAFRHVGVGIVRGNPSKGTRGATCVANVGRRG